MKHRSNIITTPVPSKAQVIAARQLLFPKIARTARPSLTCPVEP